MILSNFTKKSIVMLFIFAAVWGAPLRPARAAREQKIPPEVSAKSAIAMDVQTGKIFFEKNADEKRKMASTTKIMTCLVALENADPEGIVTVGPGAAGIEGSSLYLKAGEKIKLLDLLYGLMLNSGNDAAMAAAEHVGGSLDGFVVLMNEKARALGLSGTNFENPSGLDGESHYTTARDLAELTRYALQNPLFRAIVGTRETMAETSEERRYFKNHNKLLRLDGAFFGVKTGYTKKSGRCLVSAVGKNGIEAVIVTLDAPSDWDDHQRLAAYSLDGLEIREVFGEREISKKIPVANGEKEYITGYNLERFRDIFPVGMDLSELEVIVKTPKHLFAPVRLGRQVGKIEVFWNGNLLFETGLYAVEEVQAVRVKGFWERFFSAIFFWRD